MQPEKLPPKLLLIEDNDIDVELVRRIAARYPVDIDIVHATNGIEALDVLNNPDDKGLIRPYIVLLDINMPMMNGIELLKHIAKNGPKLNAPIYILSTSDSESDRKKFCDFDIAGYLVKPLTRELFADIIKSHGA